ncbi:hypothetical protein HRW07_07780 [Streptomyces lunaelactis]|uniref:hypothetical protein n=1 Tax=Streptomyces lunaelactis TaxID=1535768 RepID=UPI00158524B8|nr:hypothetical protein [Streptomyces lunaelactis]NUL03140.1 hypothetical protein [Streptomyces lunaelactis]
MSRTIRIDDDVFAALQALAEPLVDTPNSALRKLLELDGAATAAVADDDQGEGSFPQYGLAPYLADGRLRAGQRLVWKRRSLLCAAYLRRREGTQEVPRRSGLRARATYRPIRHVRLCSQ